MATRLPTTSRRCGTPSVTTAAAASPPATTGLDAAHASGMRKRVEEAVAKVERAVSTSALKAPTARAALELLRTLHPSCIHYDHLAFRSFGHPKHNIATLAPALELLGFVQKGELSFEKKKLRAAWFAPADAREYAHLPRIFVSELKLEDQSDDVRRVINRYCDTLTWEGEEEKADADDIDKGDWLARIGKSGVDGAALPWTLPSLEDYEFLAAESGEYAAWVLTNGIALNHCAVSVHRLDNGVATAESVANLLAAEGFAMNASGGVVKVSEDGGLRQCSTLSDLAEFTFRDGEVRKVPGAYIEFAERLPLPEYVDLDASELDETQRRDGFEAGSADKIFESTKLAGA